MSTADEIAKLHDLLARGAITPDEFERQKARLLAEPAGARLGHQPAAPVERRQVDRRRLRRDRRGNRRRVLDLAPDHGGGAFRRRRHARRLSAAVDLCSACPLFTLSRSIRGSFGNRNEQELRRRRHRRRPRWLHRRDPRSAAGLCDRLHRRVEEQRRRAGARRHLHQRRLHPVQGAAAVVRALRARRPPLCRPRHRDQGPRIDLAKMLARKDTVVKQNNDGILYLFKKNKVTFFHGRGSFVGRGDAGIEIKVSGATEETLVARTSSSPPARTRARCPAPRSTRSKSCPTTARWHRATCPSAGRDRRRRHRPGDGLGVAPPGRRRDRARGAADLPRRGRRADREGGGEGLHQAGPEDRTRRARSAASGSRRRARSRKCAWHTPTRRAPRRRSPSTG